MPRELDTSRLQQFKPKPRKAVLEPNEKLSYSPKHAKEPEEPTELEAWPSREVSKEGQFTIRAPQNTIARFRKMCKEDRRTYADMLEILMNFFDEGASSS